MLTDEHNSLSQRELLVWPLLHGLLEGGTRQEHRSRSGDNPPDMQGMLRMSCRFGFSQKWPVSKRVNSSRADDDDLIEKVELATA
jgi:hypothetical protein